MNSRLSIIRSPWLEMLLKRFRQPPAGGCTVKPKLSLPRVTPGSKDSACTARPDGDSPSRSALTFSISPRVQNPGPLVLRASAYKLEARASGSAWQPGAERDAGNAPSRLLPLTCRLLLHILEFDEKDHISYPFTLPPAAGPSPTLKTAAAPPLRDRSRGAVPVFAVHRTFCPVGHCYKPHPQER